MFISLKFKIFILLVSFFSLVITFNMFYDLNRSEKQLLRNIKYLNEATSTHLDKTIKSSLYSLDYTSVKYSLDSYDNKYFKDIYILNKDAYIFAQVKSNKIKFEKYKNFLKIKQNNANNPFIYLKEIKISNKTIAYLLIENDTIVFDKIIKEQNRDIIYFFFFLLFFTTIVSYLLSIIILKPINKMIINIKKLEENKAFVFSHSNDEFGYLSKIIEINYKRIQDLNDNLENKVESELEKNFQKDKVLQTQNLHAAMGEMMDAIAHQWKQPLGAISLLSQNLTLKSELKLLNKNDIDTSNEKITLQINHLLSTLDEFRSFFRPNKTKNSVFLFEHVKSTLALMKDEMDINNIDIKLNSSKNEFVTIHVNEFKHVLINLINNSKDAFLQNNIVKRKIIINIYNKDDSVILEIKDNAGGIKTHILNNIFEANISSKEEGTGIGLYMSKLIIEKIDASIHAENVKDGACFTICFKTNKMKK